MAAAIQDYGTLSAFVHVRERKAKLNLALSLLLLYFLFILILFLPTDFFPLLISFSFPLLGYVRSIRDAFLPLARHADKLESTFLSLSLSRAFSLFSFVTHEHEATAFASDTQVLNPGGTPGNTCYCYFYYSCLSMTNVV